MPAKTLDPLDNAYAIYQACFANPRTCDLETALARGMIAYADLVDGGRYQGYCRNATEAVWKADQNCFVIDRYKFGATFEDMVDYPDPKAPFDVFVPVLKL